MQVTDEQIDAATGNHDVVDQRGLPTPPPQTGDDAMVLMSMSDVKGQRLKMGLVLAAVGLIGGILVGVELQKVSQARATARDLREGRRRTSHGARRLGRRPGTPLLARAAAAARAGRG